MPSTVLGKRSRAIEQSPTTAQAKRRITLNGPNDENENPFITKKHDASQEDAMDVDIAGSTKKTRSTRRVVPAKHGEPETRIELSPGKADQRMATTTVDIYQDESTNGNLTPKTPRHRDALSKRIPITPRHRILVTGSTFSLRSPKTPRTPRTPSNEGTAVYNEARRLFSRCSNPGRLVGRDEERSELSGFVQTRIDTSSGGCLYVSGPPGTGKSAFVGEVLQELSMAENLGTSMVNCMSVRNTKDLSQKLVEDLDLPENATIHDLGSIFVRTKARDSRQYLVILDEVDRLVDLDLALLYNLFEWSMHKSSRLILVGIANALDLTDRFLPRLKSRNLKPQLLPFMPYTASQIAEVITSKLKSVSTGESQTLPFLQPAAIQFCAKKVAAQTGDLRKAFDICRRAVDLIEQEIRNRDNQGHLEDSPKQTPLTENVNLSSPLTPVSPTKRRVAYTFDTAPKATIAHMARITAQVFSNGATQRLSNLNLQQKAVLCALAALEKKLTHDLPIPSSCFAPSTPSKRPTAPTVKQLFEAYSTLCRRDRLLHPLSSLEFRDVVSGLETLSLLVPADATRKTTGGNGRGGFGAPITPSRTPGRKSSMPLLGGDERRVASAVGGKELVGSLEGPGSELLKEILEAGL